MFLRTLLILAFLALARALPAAPAALPFPPDLVFAADGSGDFTSIFAAVQSIPKDNRERRFIFEKNGTYRERVRVTAACITNLYGERAYFHASRRAGGDFAWHRDNLADAPGSPKSEHVTAKWTFGGKWDPERTDAPVITAIRVRDQAIELEFSEAVTVKGSPRVALTDGTQAVYQLGGGTKTLSFAAPVTGRTIRVAKLDLNRGTIVATEAASILRLASPNFPFP